MIASDIGLDDLSLGYNAPMDSCSPILGRGVTGGGGDLPSSLALVVSRATNRLGGAGYYHDVLGNLVTMPAADGVGTVSMTYLDQGHIGTLTDAAGIVWKYYYDADGKRRIKVKTAGGAATEPDGQGGVRLVADRSYYFYEGENLICQQDIGALVQDDSQYEPKFLLLDHLGSTRAELVFDPSTLAPQIQEYYDLMPYGEVIDPPTTQESVLFTGKPRDNESSVDYFGFRFLNNLRWTSPDPLESSSNLGDPQSWNKYSYVGNNPLVLVDRTGLMGSGFGTLYVDEFGRESWNGGSAPLVSKNSNETKLSGFKITLSQENLIIRNYGFMGGGSTTTPHFLIQSTIYEDLQKKWGLDFQITFTAKIVLGDPDHLTHEKGHAEIIRKHWLTLFKPAIESDKVFNTMATNRWDYMVEARAAEKELHEYVKKINISWIMPKTRAALDYGWDQYNHEGLADKIFNPGNWKKLFQLLF